MPDNENQFMSVTPAPDYDPHVDEITMSEQVEEAPDFDDSAILPYLVYICNYLAETSRDEIEEEEVMETLEDMEDSLRSLSARYGRPAPKGAAAARQTMSEIILNLRAVVREAVEYLKDPEHPGLKDSKKLIYKTNGMITALKSFVSQKRLEIAEILSKLESGELKEGEPLKEEMPESFNLTDEDIDIEIEDDFGGNEITKA